MKLSFLFWFLILLFVLGNFGGFVFIFALVCMTVGFTTLFWLPYALRRYLRR